MKRETKSYLKNLIWRVCWSKIYWCDSFDFKKYLILKNLLVMLLKDKIFFKSERLPRSYLYSSKPKTYHLHASLSILRHGSSSLSWLGKLNKNLIFVICSYLPRLCFYCIFSWLNARILFIAHLYEFPWMIGFVLW